MLQREQTGVMASVKGLVRYSPVDAKKYERYQGNYDI